MVGTDDLRVRILGTPAAWRSDAGESAERPILPAKQADLLVALALSPDGRRMSWLRKNLWPDLPADSDNSAITTTINALRNALRNVVDIPDAGKAGLYRLAVDRHAVDCWRFVDGVRALPEDAEPAAIDDLLALWQGDPWDQIRPRVIGELWDEVRRYVELLIERVARVDDPVRELPNWARFRRLLAGNDLLERFAEHRSVSPQRRRVLVVDDQIGGEMADILGDYEVDVIDSLPAWNLRKNSRRPLDYACALVDLHLKRSMVDGGGLEVIKDLREHTTTPIVLLSAELPAFSDPAALGEQLGASKVIPKHNRVDGAFTGLGEIVRSLVAD